MFEWFKNIFLEKAPILNDDDIQLLEKEVFFYNQLSEDNKLIFQQEVAYFLAQIPIHFQNLKKTRLVELLVASSAIIVTFGHHFRYKNHISSVIIINGIVTKTTTGYTTGEVHFGNGGKTMYLTQQSLIQGFRNDSDKKNVGIHEFVHILDVADGTMDGVPSFFMPRILIDAWKNLTVNEMKAIKIHQSSIDAYGAKNEQEFLTVCSEFFFERPRKLQKDHPEVYTILSSTFNYDPAKSYDFQTKKNFKSSKKIGRNDPCPCGSGKKYKKCCLNKV